MNVKVLLFAHTREIVGSADIQIDIERGSTGEALLDKLERLYPEMGKHRPYLKLSMNGTYLANTQEIEENAEVAVFPPVSGG